MPFKGGGLLQSDPILWSESTWLELQEAIKAQALAIIPVGATEQHSHHLPVCTDSVIASELAIRCAGSLNGRPHAVVAPCVWGGYSPHHMGFPGAISVESSTLSQIINDVCVSLIKQGFRNILLFNGHGGNTPILSTISLDLGAQYSVRIASLDYWQLINDDLPDLIQERPADIGHASELETSLLMVFRPDLVRRAAIRDLTPVEKPIETPAVEYVDMRSLTTYGHLGHPEWSGEDKGRRIAAAVVRAFPGFVRTWLKGDDTSPEDDR